MGNIHGGQAGAAGDTPTFLPEGAFVVQLKTGTATAEDSFAGRAEHVVSGRATQFASPAELLAFLNDVLRPYLTQAQIHEPRSARGSRNRQGGKNV